MPIVRLIGRTHVNDTQSTTYFDRFPEVHCLRLCRACAKYVVFHGTFGRARYCYIPCYQYMIPLGSISALTFLATDV
jgi:hypothetical protein